MTKIEFLNVLREDLDGLVTQQVINENIAYYSSYFDEQVMNGRSEEDICMELGNPSLTARTIIDANEDAQQVVYNDEVYTDNTYADNSQEGYYQDDYTRDDRGYNPYGNVKMVELKWYHGVLIFVAIALIIALFVFLSVTVLTVAGPFIIGLLLFYYIRKYFWGRS